MSKADLDSLMYYFEIIAIKKKLSQNITPHNVQQKNF